MAFIVGGRSTMLFRRDPWQSSRRFGHVARTLEYLIRRQQASDDRTSERRHRQIIERKHELRTWLIRIRDATNRKYPHSFRRR